MKPIWISMEDYKNDNEHVYAVCHCTFIAAHEFRAIQLNKQPRKTRYRFRCEDCGVTGEVICERSACN